MKAVTLLDERIKRGEHVFVQLRVMQVSMPVRGSAHSFKYSLALVVKGECVLRFDNEAGKGDHFHLRGIKHPYTFTTPLALLADFWEQVDQWRQE